MSARPTLTDLTLWLHDLMCHRCEGTRRTEHARASQPVARRLHTTTTRHEAATVVHEATCPYHLQAHHGPGYAHFADHCRAAGHTTTPPAWLTDMLDRLHPEGETDGRI